MKNEIQCFVSKAKSLVKTNNDVSSAAHSVKIFFPVLNQFVCLFMWNKMVGCCEKCVKDTITDRRATTLTIYMVAVA